MDELAERVGRATSLVSYHGHPEAERVLVLAGSGAVTARRTRPAAGLRRRAGRRPPDPPDQAVPGRQVLAALPPTARRVAVLDRTKEPGSEGEPLFLDVVAALGEAHTSGERDLPLVSSAAATGSRRRSSRRRWSRACSRSSRGPPAAPVHGRHRRRRRRHQHRHRRAARHRAAGDGAGGVLRPRLRRHGRRKQEHDQDPRRRRALRPGLLRVRLQEVGLPDGLASALRRRADRGAVPRDRRELRRLPPVRPASTIDVLGRAADGATLLLDCPDPPDEVWDALPLDRAEAGAGQGIQVFAIDATRVAREAGLPGRTNTVLQTCFFALSGVLPRDEAIARIKEAIEHTYARRGAEVVDRNNAAVDSALEALHAVEMPGRLTSRARHALAGARLGARVRPLGDRHDAGRPRRRAARERATGRRHLPERHGGVREAQHLRPRGRLGPDTCIQCGSCSFVCPHSVIRSRFYGPDRLDGAPDGFPSAPLDARGLPDARFTLQVYVEDCTGCALCVEACPVHHPTVPSRKAINLEAREPLVDAERRTHRVLRDAARQRPLPRRLRQRSWSPVPPAAVRVLGSVRRVRRDAVPEAALAALR